MSSEFDASAGGPAIVTVEITCRGPVGGRCGRTLRTEVPAYDSPTDTRGVRCSKCERINEAENTDVVAPGGEGA